MRGLGALHSITPLPLIQCGGQHEEQLASADGRGFDFPAVLRALNCRHRHDGRQCTLRPIIVDGNGWQTYRFNGSSDPNSVRIRSLLKNTL